MDKKAMIIENATVLFAEKGYYGLGLAELLKKCDIPKGSFYYFFPGGKKELVAAVLEESYRQMKEGIEKRIFVEDDVKQSFIVMADRLIARLNSDQHFQSLTLSFLAIESVYLDQEINDICKRIYEDWQNLYYDKFISGGYDEETSRKNAQLVFAIMHGSVISSWIKQDKADLEIAKEMIRELL